MSVCERWHSCLIYLCINMRSVSGPFYINRGEACWCRCHCRSGNNLTDFTHWLSRKEEGWSSWSKTVLEGCRGKLWRWMRCVTLRYNNTDCWKIKKTNKSKNLNLYVRNLDQPVMEWTQILLLITIFCYFSLPLHLVYLIKVTVYFAHYYYYYSVFNGC